MAQLWGGRFTGETASAAYEFNASIGFDRRLFHQDIQGSIAHARMLAARGIIEPEERDVMIRALGEILEDVDRGRLSIDESCEDIHSFVEAELVKRIQDTGKKLHTGRSRNDQVALDMRLYTRKRVLETEGQLAELLSVILGAMEENLETYMPGFTHLQKAQPVTLAHHYGAYFEMFRRDRLRLGDIYRRMNYCPLGAGALAGTTFPLDREYTASLLGFDGPAVNSMDAVSDRDYLIEFLAALSTVMMHLSRFCEEIILWNSNEYQFVEIDDAYATGSSIMPQKKNPDIAELVRGKTGRVYGALVSLLTTMKGLPLAYNKDMQEDKEVAFDAMDTVGDCLALFTGMLRTMKFRKDRMAASARNGFANATDAADYLAAKGVPFRDAHAVVGRLVLYCIEKGTSIDELSLEELQGLSDKFEADIYEAVAHMDLTRNANRTIIKLLVLNGIILFVISCFWVGGFGITVVYSLVLYVILRRYVSELQKRYRILLKAVDQIAEGRLDVVINEDLGVFEPFREQVYKIQDGLQKAVDAEVRSQRMKVELVTNMSHDLKTPLTAIITYVNLLKVEGITEEQRRDYLATLERKSLRLKGLIEDLFEFSKASSQNVTLNIMDVDIMNLVKQVAFEMSDKLGESGLDVRMNLTEEKVILPLDSQKTYRVYENLFGNIAKYALPGTRVYVNGFRIDDTVVITLKNISAQEITVDSSELTERFVRGDASRNTEGSGLGLAIAKSFTELQGGILELEVDGDLFEVTTTWKVDFLYLYPEASPNSL